MDLWLAMRTIPSTTPVINWKTLPFLSVFIVEELNVITILKINCERNNSYWKRQTSRDRVDGWDFQESTGFYS